MTDEKQLPDGSTSEGEEEESTEDEPTEEESTEDEPTEDEPTAADKMAEIEAENAKLRSDNENYKKAVKSIKQRSKPKDLPTDEKGEFITKKEFYSQSQAEAKKKARDLYPELDADEHWNEIITEYYSDKKRKGVTAEENIFRNLENAAILFKAKQGQVDNSVKNATAQAANSRTAPSKGDTSQSRKDDNTESENYYLDKLVPNRP